MESQIINQMLEDGSLSPRDQQTTRLIQHLQACSQEYAQANEHSLDRIWSRLVQHQDQPFSLLAQWKPSEEKIIILKERKAMQDTPISGGMNSSSSLFQPKKRRSLRRVVGLSLVAAVVLITIVSFTLFSGLLRSTAPTANKGAKTITSAPTPQQTALSHGTLVCSFSAGPEVMLTNVPWNPALAWSSQGEIAVVSYASVKAYSAQNCTSTTFAQSSIQRTDKALWSPDGKKLLVGDVGDNSVYVLNSQGMIIAHLSNASMAITWSSDSTKIFFAAQDSRQELHLVQSMDLSNGNQITTLATFPGNSVIINQLSPDGKLALVEQANAIKGSKSVSASIWDVNSVKKISDLPSNVDKYGIDAAFSPDGSQLAVSMAGVLQIYTTNGHLLTSFKDTSPANEVQTLAWSPNSKYLAKSSNAIKIYNSATKKLVATFGAVDAQHQIISLAWAPDNTGIASTTIVLAGGIPDDNMVNVWKLS
ncbi:MAG TPA: hypothetical protein VGD98_07460 [Ktedonobacteraceae bacterium]